MEHQARVWAKDSEGEWRKAEIIRRDSPRGTGGESKVVVRFERSTETKEFSVPRGSADLPDLKLRNVTGQASLPEGTDVEDLIELTHLHEPAILYTLSERYDAEQIYTYTGPILLAVNPFRAVSLYSSERLQRYQADGQAKYSDPDHVSTLPPHVYAVADAAYRLMSNPASQDDKVNQSILVSGESGAGKTETTKIVMRYLAIVGGRHHETDHGELAVFGIEQRVLQSNPILEAFGNARTVRNDNSSRFGKFIEIHFDGSHLLVGAAVRTFLLEKVRLVSQARDERNYHIFYLLCAGAAPEEKARWRIGDVGDYWYLGQSGCYERRDGVRDDDGYREVMEAFSIVGITEAEVDSMMQVVSAVLHLGNLQFEAAPNPDRENQDDISVVTAETWADAEVCAELLGVGAQALQRALTYKVIETVGERYETPLTPEQSAHGRDALAKAVYSGLFDWLVSRLNECIADEGAAQTERRSSIATGRARGSEVLMGKAGGHRRKPSDVSVRGGGAGAAPPGRSAGQGGSTFKNFIGLLDIFGFETFEHNYFEQFLINYANEMLQQQFNTFVFEVEQEEYRQERITWSFVSFPDNTATIEMIQGKGGLLALLDEACLFPKSTDETFAKKTYKELAGKPHAQDRFVATVPLQVEYAFVVRHYAGEVEYQTEGFVEKNRDTLHSLGSDLLQSSEKPFVKTVGGVGANLIKLDGVSRTPASSAGNKRPGPPPRPGARLSGRFGGGAKKGTLSGPGLSAQFKQQLAYLLEKIGHTHPHYIRCLKPNDQNVAHRFNPARIAEQLRYGGVLEAVRVARAGFPVRLAHPEFVKRYGLLAVLLLERAIAEQKGGGGGRSPAAAGNQRSGLGGLFGGRQEKAAARRLEQGGMGSAVSRNLLGLKELAPAAVKAVAQALLVHLAPELQGEADERRRAAQRAALTEAARGDERAFQAAMGAAGVQVGLTKCFFRQAAFNALERARTAKLVAGATRIQAAYRRHREQAWYEVVKFAVRFLQRVGRGRLGRRRAHRVRTHRAALRIQTAFRCQKAHKAYQRRVLEERTATALQGFLRSSRDRKRFLVKRAAAVRIQATLRRKAAAARMRVLKRKSKDVNHLKYQLEEFRAIVNKKATAFDQEHSRAQWEWAFIRADHKRRAAKRAPAEKARLEAFKKAEEERIAAEKKAEEERIAAEKKAEEAAKKAEQERVAAEKAAQEAAKRAEQERIAAEKKAEEERIAAQKAEQERQAALKKAEEERIAAEKAEQARLEAERREKEESILAAKKRAEEDRRAAEQARLRAERVAEENRAALERAEQARFEAERRAEEAKVAAEKKAEEDRLAAEQGRLEAEKQAEENRLVAEEAERARLSFERKAGAARRAAERELAAAREELSALRARLVAEGGATLEQMSALERRAAAAQTEAAAARRARGAAEERAAALERELGAAARDEAEEQQDQRSSGGEEARRKAAARSQWAEVAASAERILQEELEALKKRNAELVAKLQGTPTAKAQKEAAQSAEKTRAAEELEKKARELKAREAALEGETTRMQEELQALQVRNRELQREARPPPPPSNAAGRTPPPTPQELARRARAEEELKALREKSTALERELKEAQRLREEHTLEREVLRTKAAEVDLLRRQNQELQKALEEAQSRPEKRLSFSLGGKKNSFSVQFSDADKVEVHDVFQMRGMEDNPNSGDGLLRGHRRRAAAFVKEIYACPFSEVSLSGSDLASDYVAAGIDLVQETKQHPHEEPTVLYRVQVKTARRTWTVERRYRDFRFLNAALAKHLGGDARHLPGMPSPRVSPFALARKENVRHLQLRRTQLDFYLKELVLGRSKWLIEEEGSGPSAFYCTSVKDRLQEAVARQSLLLFLDENQPGVDGPDDGLATFFTG